MEKHIEGALNVDIAGKVSELETLLKRVLPKNIMWRMVLSRGMEFDGYRDYTNIDDASDIDWKATVRSGKPLLKKYIEEKDRKFFFFVDVSDNMVFGSTEKLKCEYVTEFAASLAHLILGNGDRTGFMLYSDHIVKIRVPELGNRQFDIFANELSTPENYGGASNLNIVLETLLKTLDRSTSLVFIISDFLKVDDRYRKNLEILSSLFETVAFIVRDPLDNSLPPINNEIVIEDPETKEKLLINPKVARGVYEANAIEQLNKVKLMMKDVNIDFIEMPTNENSSVLVANFLIERVKGGRITKKNVH